MLTPVAPRLHLFTGKGGVGKTTLAAAIALERAEAGGRPVLVELGHRSSLASVLGLAPGSIGHRPREVSRGVWASNVVLEHALGDYLARRVGSRTIARRIAASRGLAPFFEAAPAVPELLTLEHVGALLADFEPVIVDLDATGHALMFLELPALLAELAPSGPIGELVRGLGALLADATTTRIHLVTLASALPIEETCELGRELLRRGAPLGSIFVNRRSERPLPTAHEREARALVADERVAPTDRAALALALDDARGWDEQVRQLDRLAVLGRPCVVLPELGLEGERLDVRSLTTLGALARGGLA